MRPIIPNHHEYQARSSGSTFLLPASFAAIVLLLSAQWGWAQQDVDSPQEAEAAPQAGETHSGTLVIVREGQLTASTEAGEQHSHRITDETKITINGEQAQVEDLREGDRIQVTLGEDNVATAIAVTRDRTPSRPARESQQGPSPNDNQPQGREADEQIQQRGQQHAFLGVQIAPASTEGALVIAVQPDSPADKAGIQEGDIVVSADGQPLSSPNELRRFLEQKQVDDQVRVGIRRDGRQEEVNVTLGSRQMTGYRGQPQWPGGVPQMFGADVAWLGIVMQDESPEEQGVMVARVYPSGPAARGGLRQGDVIVSIGGQQVAAPNDVVNIIESAEPGDELNLVIRRDGQEQEQTVHLGRRSEFLGSMFRGGGTPSAFQDFGIPESSMMLEQHRRLAEQHERIEQLLREVQNELRQLREELRQQRNDGASADGQADAP